VEVAEDASLKKFAPFIVKSTTAAVVWTPLAGAGDTGLLAGA
jgi:hypothetical protein